jgi:hypothetical protein
MKNKTIHEKIDQLHYLRKIIYKKDAKNRHNFTISFCIQC